MKENLILLNTGIFNINTWIIKINQNKVLIIDPASCKESNDEEKITNYLKQNNLIPLGIILTHGHFDHIAGIKKLKQDYPSCKIIIHKDDSLMATVNAYESQKDILIEMGISFFVNALKDLPKADVTVNNKETLNLFFEEKDSQTKQNLSQWQILHTPGHTPGGICLYNKTENILISGDTLFYKSYGRTDLPGGDFSKIMNSLKFLKTLPKETKVYPGHDYYDFYITE